MIRVKRSRVTAQMRSPILSIYQPSTRSCIADNTGVPDRQAVDCRSGKPTSKAHAKDLVQLLPAHDLLPENHPEGKRQQQHAVPKVTKHDSKEEGEGDNREGGWVGLPVLGHTICVHNLLERVGDFVGLEVCGWLLICHQGLEDGAHL